MGKITRNVMINSIIFTPIYILMNLCFLYFNYEQPPFLKYLTTLFILSMTFYFVIDWKNNDKKSKQYGLLFVTIQVIAIIYFYILNPPWF